MVAAGTFHAVSTELAIGALGLAAFAALLATLSAWIPMVQARLAGAAAGLDAASLWGAGFGLAMLPVAIITGTLAAGPTPGASPFVVNKMLLSGFCLALWLGFIHGRLTLGAGLWSHRRLATLQGITAITAWKVTAMLGSIGGVLGRGETILDLIPFMPHLDTAPVMGLGASAAMTVLGFVAIAAVLILSRKPAPASGRDGPIA